MRFHSGKAPRRRPRGRAVVPSRAEVFEPRVLFSVFTVTSTADSGPGSLRQAILDANADSAADEIHFDVAGAGVHTITPLSALPAVTQAVSIDGTTQAGYAGTPVVELDGSAAGAAADGLVLRSSAFSFSALIRGLAVNRFGGNGILVFGNNVRVEASHIGVDASGAAARPNGGAGVLVSGGNGVTIGGTSEAQRNVISGNAGAGIRLARDPSFGGPGPGLPVVQGNFIGTDMAGAVAIGNGQEGVLLEGGDAAIAATIGGDAVGAGNVISGNGASGVRMIRPIGSTIQGNRIGVDASGTRALANGSANAQYRDGLTLALTNVNTLTIGGTTAGARNIISGNVGAGIFISNVGFGSSSSVDIRGNFIGTDSTGGTDLGNGGDGINTTKTGGAFDGNLVSGNAGDGVHLQQSDFQLDGNYIGTNFVGSRAIGNDGDGIEADTGSHITIRGRMISVPPPPMLDPTGIGRSLISGNGQNGIRLTSERTTGGGNVSWQVFSNFIGTDLTGTIALGNGGSGVYVTGIGFRIGNPGQGNVISGNRGDGVTVTNIDAFPSGITAIQGNLIGTNADGAAALGNGGDGVGIVNATGAMVGSQSLESPTLGNTIANNRGAGVRVTGGTARRNRVSLNRIYSNGELGIDLGGDGVTLNDPLDADGGPNGLQNFPVIAAAASMRTRVPGTVVQFSLHSEPNTLYAVEFFDSTTRDASGYGEGATFLGSAQVTTDASGDATARVTVARAEPGSWITATSTNWSSGSTSEFSAAVRVAERSVLGRRTDYGDPGGGGGTATAAAAVSVPLAPSEPARRLLSPRRVVYELQ